MSDRCHVYRWNGWRHWWSGGGLYLGLASGGFGAAAALGRGPEAAATSWYIRYAEPKRSATSPHGRRSTTTLPPRRPGSTGRSICNSRLCHHTV